MNEAERLAKFLDDHYDLFPERDELKAAAELRRLVAINAELEIKVKRLEAAIDRANKVYLDANFRMSK